MAGGGWRVAGGVGGVCVWGGGSQGGLQGSGRALCFSSASCMPCSASRAARACTSCASRASRIFSSIAPRVAAMSAVASCRATASRRIALG